MADHQGAADVSFEPPNNDSGITVHVSNINDDATDEFHDATDANDNDHDLAVAAEHLR